MKPILLLGTWAALATGSHAQIILTEVMYNPRGSENANEFVELYNLSESDTASLAGWKIGDQNAFDEILSPGANLKLPPQHYAVILDPNYFQSSTQYDSLLPSEALILTLADNTFGSGGFSNNLAEPVILVDANGDTVARYLYSLGNPDGISDEKINLVEDDSFQNWANALRADGSPGFTNSVAPRQIDGELVPSSLRISPRPLRENFPALISVVIRNAGILAFSRFSVSFELIPTGPGAAPPASLGNLPAARVLAAADTVQLDFTVSNLRPGRYRLHARLLLEDDAYSGNDTSSISIAVGWRREVMVINEVMFDPAGGQPEWIEIYNPQDFGLSLGDWVVEDESGSKSTAAPLLAIPSRSYRVLTVSDEVAKIYDLPDSTVILLHRLPSLNNSGDAILLRDFGGTLIDSLAYEGDWGKSGISIEKIWHERGNSKRNWLPSNASRGATPAAFNSISPREYDLGVSTLQFSPGRPRAGDEVKLVAQLKNQGRRTISQFSVSFYYEADVAPNREDAVLLAEVPITQELAPEDSLHVEISWQQPRSGRSKLTAEVRAMLDEVAENNRAVVELPVGYPARTVIINEIYPAPASNEIEWYEIYNRSAAPVNLAGWLWQEGEAVSPVTLSDTTILLQPGQYAVISGTGSIPNLDEGALRLSSAKWLSLNNEEDKVAVFDFNSAGQDSVRFNARWGGSTGVSLERINPHLASQDSSNWSSCVGRAGSTPGRANSILTMALPTAAALSISPNPFSPDADGFDDFALLQIDLPLATAAVQVKIYDLRGRLIRHFLNNQPVGSHYEAIWNGHDDRGERVRTGLYIVYCRALRADQGVLLEAKTTVVVARPLN
jgi:hypothetical protein